MTSRKKFKGKNTDDSTTDLFFRRTAYDVYSYESDPNIPSDEVIKDFRTYESLFYGRVDTEQNVILPKNNYLVRLPSKSQKTFYALDFVVDAYTDLLKTATMRIQDGGLPLQNADGSEEQYIGPYEIGRAYSNVGKAYNDHMKEIFNIFYDDYLLTRGKVDKVANFDDFMNVFEEFAKIGLAPAVPVNLSSFLLSRFGSILDTGLAIEIGELDHGDDEKKQDLFIDNRRFGIHKNLAAEYGFWIDKNAPWRLVANLGSSQMQAYISKRYPENSDLNSLFSRYYQKSTQLDIKFLKNITVRFYNQLATNKPLSRIPYEKNGCTHYRVVTRQTIGSGGLKDDAYWIERYIRLKGMESYVKYDSYELPKIVKNALDINRAFDFDRAVGYIDYKFKGFASIPNSSQFDQLTDSLDSTGKYDSGETRDIINLFARSENIIVY